LVEV